MKKTQRYRRKFLVLPNGQTNTRYCEQGIEYESGLITVGLDNWRNLNPVDCSSHDVQKFTSYLEMNRSYSEFKKKEVNRNVLPKYHARRHA